MLHREPDENGKVDWRQISGLDKHGEYGMVIPVNERLVIARETREYENAFLTQQIEFLGLIQEYFAKNRLRHVQKVYDDRLKAFAKGVPIMVMAYHDGQLEKHRIMP